MPTEVLQEFVIVQGHVADCVVLSLLVGGIHDGIGGMSEVDKVAAVLMRLDHLLLLAARTVIDHHLVVLAAGDQAQPVIAVTRMLVQTMQKVLIEAQHTAQTTLLSQLLPT